MREIKFRAFQPHSSLHRKPGMYLVDDLVFYPAHGGGEAFLYRPGGRSKSSEYFEDIKLMQYTGLKDKNGVEIYEGDIVRHGLKNAIVLWAPYISPAYTLFTPTGRYIEGDWQGSANDLDARMGSFGYAGNLEVVGNLYENPELLKVGDA